MTSFNCVRINALFSALVFNHWCIEILITKKLFLYLLFQIMVLNSARMNYLFSKFQEAQAPLINPPSQLETQEPPLLHVHGIS